MFRRTATSPDGRKWTLGRHWMPRRRRLGRADPGDAMPDFLSFDSADDLGVLGAILLAAVALVVAIVLALLLFNVVAIAIELLILIVLLVAGVVGRVVFRRPWTVFAKSGSTLHTRPVVGWRASGRAIDELAERIASGAELEPAPGDRR
jgi:hypothetical protein